MKWRVIFKSEASITNQSERFASCGRKMNLNGAKDNDNCDDVEGKYHILQM